MEEILVKILKFIRHNKNIFIALLMIIILLSCFFIIFGKIKEKMNNNAKKIYDEITDLYHYGGNIEYETDENGQRIYIEENNKKLYEISNYENSISKYFTSSKLSNVIEELNIIKKEEKYYIVDIARGLSNYLGTEIEFVRFGINKRIFNAYSKFCKMENVVSYGTGCSQEGEYVRKKRFVLEKENNEWKVDVFTSIFEILKQEEN